MKRSSICSVCLFVVIKLVSSLVDVENRQLSQAKSSHVSQNTGFAWYDCNVHFNTSSVCVSVFFLVVFYGALTVNSFFNGKTVERRTSKAMKATSKAMKKEEAKTIFKTGWHRSPDKEFFSGSVFVNSKHFFMEKKRKWTNVVQHQNQKKRKKKKEMVKKGKKKADGKCIFPLLYFCPHYSILHVLVGSVGKMLGGGGGGVEDSHLRTGVHVIGYAHICTNLDCLSVYYHRGRVTRSEKGW